jgi:hypothetical protein
MWWLIILGVLAAVIYGYSISSTIKVAGKPGCSSCPKNQNADSPQ